MKKISCINTPLFKTSRLQQALIIALCGLVLPSQVLAEQEKKESTDEIQVLATAMVQSADLKDGSSEDGYLSDGNTNIGIWQGRTLQETPYAISVVSEDLLQNLQATSTDQVFKLNPLIQINRPSAQNNEYKVISRGFTTRRASRNGVFLDKPDHGASMQEVAQVEVLTGLSGFLYGPGNIGGMVNYVTKRPTKERLNALTLGNTSGNNIYLHGDFGGRIDEDGDFGYRINLVTQDGETATDNQELALNFGSFALDWQVTDSLLLQLDGASRDYTMEGLQAKWKLDNAIRPDAKSLDSDKLWSQKWAKQHSKNDRLGASLTWELNASVSLRASYLKETTERHYKWVTNIINADNTYTQSIFNNQSSPTSNDSFGGFIFLDVNFDTGTINHKLVTGIRFSSDDMRRYKHFAARAESGPFSLVTPSYIPEPTWQTFDDQYRYTSSKAKTNNLTIGDDIRFNEQWSALIGFTRSNINYKRYRSDNTLRSSYDESATTPSLSLVYQPLDFINTYVSYMEGLERGGQAGNEPDIVNAGEIMAPITSVQIELGAKIDLDGILLTTAVFEIDKPLEYYININTSQRKYVQDGRQVHRGLEFTATGKLSDNLTLVGGFTLLDAKVKNNEQNPELQGNTPAEVAEKMFKFYGEYNLSSVPELVLNAGFSHTGSFYSQIDNKEKLDGYTLVDIGARYQLDLVNTPITFRFNISNLTDKHYWVNNEFIGDGRRVALSANVSF